MASERDSESKDPDGASLKRAAGPADDNPDSKRSRSSSDSSKRRQLSSEQSERLAKAQAYAKEMTQKLKKQQQQPLSQASPSLPPALLATNPHVASGVDLRTLAVLSRIYVGSINFELGEQQIRDAFTQFGSIKSVSMTVDPATMRHKGYCFIEYETPEAAALALDVMHGSELGGRQLKVGRPNNYTAASSVSVPTPPASRIYVSNVNQLITEDNMQSIFEAFGKIRKCILLPDLLTRKHKGYGFIEFEEDSAALAAIMAMNNFEIGGQHLRVSRCLIGGPLGEGMKVLEKMPANGVLSKVASNIQQLGLQQPQRELPKKDDAAAIAKEQVAARVQGTLVDSVAKEENLHVGASQRYEIMQKLAASREVLSPVLLVENAVSASEVDDDLKDEFAEECNKFGKVKNVRILDGSDGGDVKILIEFETIDDAERARKVLNGRWFGGRQLKAYIPTQQALKDLV